MNKPDQAKPKGRSFWSDLTFVRLSMKEQTFFAKRLSFLIKANIPILDSLHMIREQTKSKRYARLIDSVIHDVSNGQFLSVGLAKFNRTFGDFAINIISVGESTGILSDNLEYLAEEMKKKQILRRKVVGAFIYPAIVTVATLGITGFLMVYLFPKIMPVFTSLHMTLPLSTRIVVFLSDFLRHYGLWLLGLLIIGGVAFSLTLHRVPKVRLWVDQIILKLPVVGKVVQSYNLANLCRTLGLLLKSGITLSEALPITAKTTENLVYRREFGELSRVVEKGEKISTYFRKAPAIFTDVLAQLTSVGERSGNLSNSLIYISELYEAEVEDFTKNLSALIEPALMIFMGIMVGFIAISIITPIYGITQHLNPR